MKLKYFNIILFCTVGILTGCSKFLNVNTSPNDLTDVSESLILAPLETSIASYISGGSDAVLTNEWMQIMTPNQIAPNTATYYVTTSTFDGYWPLYYNNVLNNIYLLNLKADANGDDIYAGISKVLMAYALGYATDLWGDIPYSKSFQGVNNSTPVYDSQESVYDSLQTLLDSAILQLKSAGGGNVPSSDDYFYKGNAVQWLKFAYTLKARDYMHLINAPGYDKVSQAKSALSALENGMTSASDDCFFQYDGSAAISAWSQYFTETSTEVMSSHIVDSLKKRNDPRMPYLISKSGENKDSIYVGLTIGETPGSNYHAISPIGSFYGAKDAKGYVFNAAEADFLKAEASYYVDGISSAQTYYQQGISKNMVKLGVASADSASYLKAYGTLESSTALSQIMYEKSIANFLSIENFTDWRRTGYPSIKIVQNASVSSIPRRFMYPYSELTENPNTPTNVSITDRVWWDTAN